MVGLSRRTLLCAAAASAIPAPIRMAEAAPAPIAYDQLVKGFVAETKNEAGAGAVPAFATRNPWGQYTAYLMSTNGKGQRTWRIEHYLPMPQANMSQGSTMYLVEGSQRALLIDTGNPASRQAGVNDLKSVIRFILSHTNDGHVKHDPLDFVVANTHNHPDHIGENALMSDRTIYYPDLDWPAEGAPANYVPIREGGGPTSHGTGTAVGEIDLGGRTLRAIAIPPHTPGSTAYLDAENQMLFSGDAVGSGYPWLQRAPFSVFVRSAHHVEEVTRSYPALAVLPGHFYQVAAAERGLPPVNGRPLDRQYLIDMAQLADDVLTGKAIGEPYFTLGRTAVWGLHASARAVYSLAMLHAPGEPVSDGCHAVRIPGPQARKWAKGPLVKAAYNIRSEFYLIRTTAGQTLYLLKGSDRAALIGSDSGSPGLDALIARLAGSLPLDVVLTGKTGHLRDADVLNLGTDDAGRAVQLEVIAFGVQPTLLDLNDRILFTGEALGMQGPDAGLMAQSDYAEYSKTLDAWRKRSDGRYDILYTGRNSEWFTSPAYVDELAKVVNRAAAGDVTGAVPSVLRPGMKFLKSDGPLDVVASIAVAN